LPVEKFRAGEIPVAVQKRQPERDVRFRQIFVNRERLQSGGFRSRVIIVRRKSVIERKQVINVRQSRISERVQRVELDCPPVAFKRLFVIFDGPIVPVKTPFRIFLIGFDVFRGA
jgi:hypothetical protein